MAATGHNIRTTSDTISFRDQTTGMASISFDHATETLTISHDGTGVIAFGDTSSDIFLGDGVTSVDLIMEVDGAIKGDTDVTLTLGSTDSDILIASPTVVNNNFDITGTLDVTGDITMGGETVLTGVTSGDITGALGYTPLSSETDDQTLDEVLTQGNTSSQNISVGAITGSSLTTSEITTSSGSLTLNPTGPHVFLPSGKKLYGSNVGFGYQTSAVSALQFYLGASIDNPDIKLHRDGAAQLALRDGSASQEFRVYNTYTDASNYERGYIGWDSNVLEIGSEKLGTGSLRSMKINSALGLTLQSNSNGQIKLLSSGNTGIVLESTGAYTTIKRSASATTSFNSILELASTGSGGLKLQSRSVSGVNYEVKLTSTGSYTKKFFFEASSQAGGQVGTDMIIKAGSNSGAPTLRCGDLYLAGQNSSGSGRDGNIIFLHDSTNSSNGNVGIGTTSPSYPLDVAGNIGLDGDNRHIYFGGANTFIGENSNSNKLELRGGGNNTAKTVFIDNDGRLGIGDSTPSYKLDVNGTGRFVGDLYVDADLDVTGDITMGGETVLTGITSGDITGALGYTPLSSETDDQTLDEVLTQGNTSSQNISVGAITGSALTIDTDTLSVDASNNRVGIGVTNPDSKLEIIGESGVKALRVRDYNDNNMFYVEHNGITVVERNYFYVLASQGAYIQNSLRVRGTLSNDQGTLSIGGDVSFDSSTMFVDSTNNRVGINDGTPSYDFDVNGTGRFVGDLYVDADLDVTGDITMGGETVLTGITSGDITGALGYTPLSSETDDQTLDEVLTQGNTSSSEITVGGATINGDIDVTGDATITGDFGVGTATPNTKLHIKEDGYGFKLEGLTDGKYIRMRGDGSDAFIDAQGQNYLILNSSGNGVKITSGSGTTRLVIGADSEAIYRTGNTLKLRTNSTDRLFISSNGSVGIGVTSFNNSVGFAVDKLYNSFEYGSDHITIRPDGKIYTNNSIDIFAQSYTNRGSTSGDVKKITFETTTGSVLANLFEVSTTDTAGGSQYGFRAHYTTAESEKAFRAEFDAFGNSSNYYYHASAAGVEKFSVDQSGDGYFAGDLIVDADLDVTGDITMGGETVLTGITSGDITGALGYTPLSSETDDQTLQEILDATSSATGTINVDIFSGYSGVFDAIQSTGDLLFNDGDIFLKSDGRVGLGVTPSLGYVKLDVGSSTNDKVRAAGYLIGGGSREISTFGSLVNYYSYNGHRFTTWDNSLGQLDRLRIINNGNVGINDGTPSYTLDVNGTGRFVNDLYVDADLDVTGDITMGGETVLTGITSGDITGALGYTPLSSETDDQTLDEVLTQGNTSSSEITVGGATINGDIDVTGDATITGALGIGTTSPSQKLHIYSDDVLTHPQITVEQDGVGDAAIGFKLTSTSDWIMGINNSDGDKFNICPNGTDVGSSPALTIQTNGNVGIGTTSPSYKLEVAGQVQTHERLRIGSGGNNQDGELRARVIRLSNDQGNSTAKIYSTGAFGRDLIYHAISHNLGYYQNTRLKLNQTEAVFNDDGADVDFRVEGSGEANALFVQGSDGKVGIGTNSPSAQLEVNGHFAATTKSFIIDNLKTGGKLQYGVVESDQHSVLIRGKNDTHEIELPEEWEWLVDPDSVTVDLTSIGQIQQLFVISQDNKKIKIGGLAINGQYNYTVYGERVDVDKLQVNV